MKTKTKLFAFLHDGTFEGDNAFYFPSHAVPYEAGMSLEQIKEGHIKLLEEGMRKGKMSEKDIKAEIFAIKEDTIALVRGAVVVDSKVVKAMHACWSGNPGNDSAVYRCNACAKHVAWELKHLTIGKGMY